MIKIPFNNTYINLGKDFYVKTDPVAVSAPTLIKFNHDFAQVLGIDNANPDSADSIAVFAGNLVLENAEPLAMAYAGHQFGGFNPQLGDGRAILLGEVVASNHIRYDIQLKGSGLTYFSRNGDGRAALGPVLREYLVSEAMVKLGVPTTRALAAVTSGEEVERTQLLPGAVLTRVATGYVRVGTFEYFAAKGNDTAVKQLADYVIDRNYPEVRQASNPYQAFLKAVIGRQAALIAQWMQLGFIHGVMNTDNMSVVGETIDYGPCAFMDAFNHDQVYSSIDYHGRYAYSNQPSIGQWNLIRLAETLLPLFGEGEAAVTIAQDALNEYVAIYKDYWLAGMRQKLGLSLSQDGDHQLVDELLNIMEANKADFTLTFYYLSQLDLAEITQDHNIRALFSDMDGFNGWVDQWRQRLAQEAVTDVERQAKMQAVNPIYIPRNHQVEAAIRAAEDHQDFSVFHALHEVLQHPYTYQAGCEAYMLPPKPEEVVHQTFCGT